MTRFEGHIDGIRNGELIGWAMSLSQPGVPTVVAVSVNGVPYTRTLACHHRADVAAAYGTPGLHGFSVLLNQPGLDEVRDVAVTCENGQPLGKGAALQLGQPGPKRDGPCLLFMHIQKTAGSAFRHAIVENYLTAEMALLYPDPPGIPAQSFALMPEEQRRSLRLVIGHFEFGIHRDLGQPFEYVTILRDPVQRVISHYRHFCYNRSLPAVTLDGHVNSLDEVLETGESMEMDNLITRLLCGSEGVCPSDRVNREWYERALANLGYFRFVGHQERSDEAWAQLCVSYGWNRGTLRQVNVLFDSPMEVSARTRAAIAAYNKYDLMLYRKITGA